MNTFSFAIAAMLITAQAEEPTISAGKVDADGFIVHTVHSKLQAGPTEIRVLQPSRLVAGRRYTVIYLLPVEAGCGSRFGDGLLEAKKLGLADKYQVIFVAPTFAHLPWYADHPNRGDIQQEKYFLDVVVPFVERTYPVIAERGGRLLLGFSKSGWGAFSLILRHPDRFAKAAAWDAPLMMDRSGKYGSGEIFGSDDNFERYRITKLLEEHAKELRGDPRLFHFGYGSFRDEHRRADALMEKLGVTRVYRDGPQRRHDWHSGWVAEGVEWLAPTSR
jgi:S-formylglutathione hydrolase FrmB